MSKFQQYCDCTGRTVCADCNFKLYMPHDNFPIARLIPVKYVNVVSGRSFQTQTEMITFYKLSEKGNAKFNLWRHLKTLAGESNNPQFNQKTWYGAVICDLREMSVQEKLAFYETIKCQSLKERIKYAQRLV